MANLGAARGVAVSEFPLTTGFADYMLFVDKRPIGVVGAKVTAVLHMAMWYDSGDRTVR